MIMADGPRSDLDQYWLMHVYSPLGRLDLTDEQMLRFQHDHPNATERPPHATGTPYMLESRVLEPLNALIRLFQVGVRPLPIGGANNIENRFLSPFLEPLQGIKDATVAYLGPVADDPGAVGNVQYVTAFPLFGEAGAIFWRLEMEISDVVRADRLLPVMDSSMGIRYELVRLVDWLFVAFESRTIYSIHDIRMPVVDRDGDVALIAFPARLPGP